MYVHEKQRPGYMSHIKKFAHLVLNNYRRKFIWADLCTEPPSLPQKTAILGHKNKSWEWSITLRKSYVVR